MERKIIKPKVSPDVHPLFPNICQPPSIFAHLAPTSFLSLSLEKPTN